MRLIPTALAALALLVVPSLGRADETPTPAEVVKPSQAWRDISVASRKLPFAKRSAQVKGAAEAYLEAFGASGHMALGSEALSLGFMQRGAEQWQASARTFRMLWANPETAETLRDQAAMQEARLLVREDLREALGADASRKALERLRAYAAELGVDERLTMRSSIENDLARVLDAVGDKPQAYELRLAVVTRDPTMVARMVRSLVGGLLGRTHALDGYDKVRADVNRFSRCLPPSKPRRSRSPRPNTSRPWRASRSTPPRPSTRAASRSPSPPVR